MKAYVVLAWVMDTLKEKLAHLPYSEVGPLMRHLEEADEVEWSEESPPPPPSNDWPEEVQDGAQR